VPLDLGPRAVLPQPGSGIWDTHPYANANAYTHTHPYAHPYAHPNTHPNTHANTHTNTHPHAHTHAHANTHTHAHPDAYTHTDAHTHTHTHTHTHATTYHYAQGFRHLHHAWCLPLDGASRCEEHQRGMCGGGWGWGLLQHGPGLWRRLRRRR
jgi:hypothetical protein